MIATPKPFVFYFEHHVMIMVSIIKGADLRTLQKYPRTKKLIVVIYSNSRSNHSSPKEVTEIVMVVLVDTHMYDGGFVANFLGGFLSPVGSPCFAAGR